LVSRTRDLIWREFLVVTAGRLVRDGTTKLIEDIEVGGLVWAADPETGEAGPRPVTDLVTGTGDKTLVDTITATDEHPFWVNSQGQWVDAEDLQPGDYLLDGTVDIRDATEQTVHNLTIGDLHTYHVTIGGQGDALVRNQSDDLTEY
jgi:hypothetical protein